MISISNVTRKLDSFDNSNQIHLKNCNIRKLAKFFIAKQEKKYVHVQQGVVIGKNVWYTLSIPRTYSRYNQI